VRLAHEALQPFGIRSEGRREDFDRDVTIEARVPGPVDLAHSAFAELVEDAIRTNCGSYHRVLAKLGFGETIS